MTKQRINLFEGKAEQYTFSLVLLVSLIPIFLPGPFVTLDGPAHLYNSSLIRNLFCGDPLVKSYFRWNPFPEPNWSGHLFLALAGVFLKPLYSLRLLVTLIFISTATGFRKLTAETFPGRKLLSWFIFPWLYSFPFMLGFFNYSLGIGLFTWIIYFWMKDHDKPSLKSAFRLLLLFACSYFSHLVLFGITVLAAGFISLSQENTRKRMLRLIALSLPFIICGLFFIIQNGTSGMHNDYSRLPVKDQLLDFGTARPLLIFSLEKEQPLGIAYAVFIFILLIISLKYKTANRYFKAIAWFTLSMIGLHFILPDSLASGGILTVRLAQMSFIGILWLLIACKPPALMQKIAATFSVLFALAFYFMHASTQQDLSADASQYIHACSFIPEGTVVLPLNFSENWLHTNFPGYGGAENHIIMLDNYEASQKHFPLLWSEGYNPEIVYGNFASSNHPCVTLKHAADLNQLPGAIICWQMPQLTGDSCVSDLRNELSKRYILHYKDAKAMVYLKK